jgi:hypothetical protein
MPRLLLPAAAALVVIAALGGCTAQTSANTPSPSAAPTGASTGTAAAPDNSALPGCSLVTQALGALVSGLSYNEDVSKSQLGHEDFKQQICVYTSADSTVQLGVTMSNIPFQEAELESYRTLPNAIADDRATAADAVLQTLKVEGGPNTHLGSSLFLFDTTWSVAIQGVDKSGDSGAWLPQLTVGAAADAAFAVRALID